MPVPGCVICLGSSNSVGAPLRPQLPSPSRTDSGGCLRLSSVALLKATSVACLFAVPLLRLCFTRHVRSTGPAVWAFSQEDRSGGLWPVRCWSEVEVLGGGVLTGCQRMWLWMRLCGNGGEVLTFPSPVASGCRRGTLGVEPCCRCVGPSAGWVFGLAWATDPLVSVRLERIGNDPEAVSSDFYNSELVDLVLWALFPYVPVPLQGIFFDELPEQVLRIFQIQVHDLHAAPEH